MFDYVGDQDDRMSTSGYAVAWSSKKQPIVTLSTIEAEFVAAASCACQAIWLRSEDQIADIFTKPLKLHLLVNRIVQVVMESCIQVD
ncbi:Leucine-rich receptor-like protein kinase family protein [Prunus dulcis]|uniref:Leucine-rich receptor-like protein kinase family protein n=1 Tax=Prunus dulcis TaxID=3755 RepID=A0A4Y1RK29_PRUDU|nr:Leucine-rich receptor-like protein kinase family protein [Prunus dulcis]